VVASDSRVSLPTAVLTDVGVKTYELGGSSAAVVAGAARPPMMAAEVTRSVIDNHNRRTPERRVNFLDTVRLFGYFLGRTASENESNEVAVAGFLSDGTPCLALIRMAPGYKKAGFISCPKNATFVVPVGVSDGKRLLLRSVEAAKKEGRPRFGSPIATLFYMTQHEGAFSSVGGGLAVGNCIGGQENFTWPIVEIAGRRYLRGIDVTDSYRPNWPAPEVIAYDESWCATLDQAVSLMDDDFSPENMGGSIPSLDLNEVDATNVFVMHIEPPGWSEGSVKPVAI
jgi:hypothetical protein